MINLLIYIDPVNKKFTPQYEELTQIQIDNSLSLGWDKKDIMLVTNFDYTYHEVKSIKVKNYSVFDQNRSAKIPAINELFERGLIKKQEVYWFHDHDAFQLTPFEVKLNKDFGFTTHGAYSKTWNAGSFFFKKSAEDIFLWIQDFMDRRQSNEQNAFTFMYYEDVNAVSERCQIMNITYNIGIYKIPQNVAASEKPIKVAHFHPHKMNHLNLYRELLPKRLMKIFNKYGIE